MAFFSRSGSLPYPMPYWCRLTETSGSMRSSWLRPARESVTCGASFAVGAGDAIGLPWVSEAGVERDAG